MEDTLNLLMPRAAPTRSCTKCLVGENEEKQKYLWIGQRGGPDCEFVWTDKIELNSVITAFEVKLCFQCQAAAGPLGVRLPELSRPDLDVRVGRCDGPLAAFWGIQPGQDAPMDGWRKSTPLMRWAVL